MSFNTKQLKSLQLPQFFLTFIQCYVTVGLYKSPIDFILKAIENQIRKEESLIADTQISKILNDIDDNRNKCSECDHQNCKACISQINQQIDFKLSEIADLKMYFESQQKKQTTAINNQSKKLHHLIRLSRRRFTNV